MSKASVQLDARDVKSKAQSYLDYYRAHYDQPGKEPPSTEYESVGETQSNDCKMLLALCAMPAHTISITEELLWLFETDWTAKREALTNGNN